MKTKYKRVVASLAIAGNKETCDYWGIDPVKVYEVRKHYFYNGETWLQTTEGQDFPTVFFVELP